MSWFNHKPLKHPKEPQSPLTHPYRLSPASERAMEEMKKKVRPKSKK